MYVSIAQFTRDYWCASELELRLEGFDRSVTRKTVVQLRRHCTLIVLYCNYIKIHSGLLVRIRA